MPADAAGHAFSVRLCPIFRKKQWIAGGDCTLRCMFSAFWLSQLRPSSNDAPVRMDRMLARRVARLRLVQIAKPFFVSNEQATATTTASIRS